MPDFLSDEWVAAFDRLIRDEPALARAPGQHPLGISHTITGCPGGRTIEYSVLLDADGGAVTSGRLAEPTVTFVCDYATAVAINRGDEPTQAVFLDGRLRVGGDSAQLLTARAELAQAGDVLAPLRATTTYPEAPAPVTSHA